jgi:hypothetical protein
MPDALLIHSETKGEHLIEAGGEGCYVWTEQRNNRFVVIFVLPEGFTVVDADPPPFAKAFGSQVAVYWDPTNAPFHGGTNAHVFKASWGMEETEDPVAAAATLNGARISPAESVFPVYL